MNTVASYNKKIIYYVSCMSSLLSCIILLVSPVLTYIGYLRISRIMFFIGLMLCFIANFLFIYVREILSDKLTKQMMIIYTIIMIFFLAALSNDYVRNNSLSKLLIPELIVFGTGFLFWAIKTQWKSILNYIISSIKNNKIFFGSISLLFILSLECVDTLNTWDSYNYYLPIANIKNIVFSPNDVILFKNCGHSSYAYMFFAGILEFVFPNTGVGARLLNVIVFFVSIILVFLIIKNVFPEMKYSLKLGLALLYAVTPSLYGPLYDISPEYLLAFFVIAYIYCYIKEYYILQFLSLLCLTFTKETAVMLVGGFFVGMLFNKLLDVIKEKKIQTIFERTFIIKFMIFYIPCLLFLLYYVIDNSGWGQNVIIETGNETYMNCFGINKTNIITKLEQMYVTNFQWIITAFVLTCCIVFLIKKKRTKRNELICLIIFSYIAFLGIHLFYVTYTFPRYTLCHYVYEILFLAFCLSCFKNIKNKYNIIIPIIICTFFVQNYVTYDPMMLLLNNNINIGETNMSPANVIAAENLDSNIVSEKAVNQFNISEYTMYNRQYLYKNQLLNEIFNNIDYKSGDLILIPDYCPPRTIFTFWTGTVYYDENKSKIIHLNSFQNQDNNIYKINYQLINNESNIDISNFDRVYILDFPYWGGGVFETVLQKYEILSTEYVEYKKWSAYIYQIK